MKRMRKRETKLLSEAQLLKLIEDKSFQANAQFIALLRKPGPRRLGGQIRHSGLSGIRSKHSGVTQAEIADGICELRGGRSAREVPGRVAPVTSPPNRLANPHDSRPRAAMAVPLDPSISCHEHSHDVAP